MNKDQLDTLSLRVFRTFARCEYAFKAAGFRSGANDVKADWRAFAGALGDLLTIRVTPSSRQP